jgi:Uri superfamily endonuclease
VELPEEKGTYILIVSVAQTKRLEIGRLGVFDLIPGYYAYVGSACGAGGIRARVGHHLGSVAAPHWHIDYLLGLAVPTEVWFAVSDQRLEQDWAELLADAPCFRSPIPRFGSSDYRRSRTSHLFYARRRPSFRWFEAQLKLGFAAEVRPQRLFVGGPVEP